MGMRERVALAGGDLELASGDAGTVVSASMPVAYAEYGNLAGRSR